MNNPLLVDEILESLRVFAWEKLPQDWVEASWNTNFMDFDENNAFDSEVIAEEDFTNAVDQCASLLKRYTKTETDSGIWAALEREGVKVKFVLAFVFSVIEAGLQREADFLQKTKAVKMAEFYLCLCSVPGALAFNVFHGILLQRAVESVKLVHKYVLQKSKTRSPTKGKKKAGRKGGTHGESSLDETSQESNADQAAMMTDIFSEFLSGGLWCFAEKMTLKDHKDTLRRLISLLVEMVPVQAKEAKLVTPVADVRDLGARNLTEKIFACLHLLSCSRHDVGAQISLGKNGLLGKFLMLEGSSGSTISAAVQKERTLALDFVYQLLRNQDPQIMDTIYALTQNLCSQVPDKAEFRKSVALQIVQLLSKTNAEIGEKFIAWLAHFSKSSKGANRGFTVDLCSQLIDLVPSLVHQQEATETILGIVWDRAFDRSPTVRARALTTFAAFLSKPGMNLLQELETVIRSRAEVDHVGKPPHELMLELFGTRCCDEKAVVRKAAVGAAEAAALALRLDAVLPELYTMIAGRCSDKGLLVRKQATESLTKLLRNNMGSELLIDLWLKAVMPLVTDRENSVVEKAIESLTEVMFKKFQSQGREEELAWSLQVKIESQLDLKRYQERAIKSLHTTSPNVLSPKLINVLEAATREPERSDAAWLLLSELCPLLKNMDPKLARITWMTLPDTSRRSVAYIAKILGVASESLHGDESLEIAEDMRIKLETFDISPPNIGIICYSLNRLLRVTAAEGAMLEWCQSMVCKCQEYLSALVYGSAQEGEPEDIIRRLFTLGELILYSPKVSTEELFTIVQALIASDRILSEASNFHRGNNRSEHQDTMARSVLLKEGGVSAAIRAHAITTLGKLCLQDEESAKKCVAALIRELTTNRNTFVRNNIIVVIADLCIRYTSLIDRHIEAVSSCLKDPSLLVRKQTLILLTSLLKEDFLRFRGVLLYRFTSMLLDEEAEIREFAEYCITNVLLVRHPDMFANHFLECLYFFNGVRHASWQELEEASSISAMFSLKGPNRKEDRMKLYLFMINQFSDPQKFTTSMKIATDILDSVVNDVIKINKDTAYLIEDAFNIMCSKEIRPTLHVAQGNDEDEVEIAVQAAGKEMMTQAIKKTTIGVVFPIILNLKTILEKKRHPLLKYLMEYLRESVKDYRNEIDDMLAGNKQLAEELLYDIRRFEEEQEAKERRRMAALNPPPPPPPVEKVTENEEKEPENEQRANGAEESVSEPADETQRTDEGDREKENVPEQEPETSRRNSDEPMDTTQTVNSDDHERSVLRNRSSSGKDPVIPVVKVEPMEEENEMPPPERRRKSSRKKLMPARAISTPQSSQLVPELTFQGGPDLSCIPNLSPVAANPMSKRSSRRNVTKLMESISEDQN